MSQFLKFITSGARLSKLFLVVTSCLACIPLCVICSEGEGTLYYTSCLRYCRNEENAEQDVQNSLILSFTLWKPDEECRYRCMRRDVEHRFKEKLPQVQYHGAWGFRRVLGVEEPMSVLFSLMHLWINLYYLPSVWSVPFHAFPATHRWLMSYALRMNVVLALCAWSCSAAWHCRHKILLERFDYTGAMFYLITSVIFAALFTIKSLQTSLRRAISVVTTIFCTGLFYTLRLIFYDFNVERNLIIAVLLFIVYTILWTRWIFFPPVIHTNHRAVRLLSLYCLSFVCASPLELFDFPPIFFETLDAHALWHGVTVFSTFMFLRFIRETEYGMIERGKPEKNHGHQI